jgi:succinate dehydrogenase / fumarate reductase flavoprotein subunit
MKIAEYVQGADFVALPANPSGEIEAEFQRLRKSTGKTRAHELRTAMQLTMMDNVGVFRVEETISKAISDLHDLKERYQNDLTIDDNGYQFNTDLLEAWELGNLLELAEITARSALNRKESRGAHSREDFKKRDDEQWLVHTLIGRTNDAPYGATDYAINTDKKVDLSLAAEDPRFAPKERVY